MNKLTKGAVSATAAAALLLGGAGSLAYWTDGTTQAGAAVTSGQLKLNTNSAGDWKLNAEAAAYNPATQKLVPGDVLAKTTVFKVDAKGSYIKATFSASNPAWAASSSSALTSELQVTGQYSVSKDGGTTWSAPTNGTTPVAVADGDLVRAVLTITWPMGTVNNNSNVVNGLSATLDAVAVTVTQVR